MKHGERGSVPASRASAALFEVGKRDAKKKSVEKKHLLRLEAAFVLTAATNILAIWQIVFHETDNERAIKMHACDTQAPT